MKKILNLYEALDLENLEEKLPLKWRRRVSKYHSRNQCLIKKMEQWEKSIRHPCLSWNEIKDE